MQLFPSQAKKIINYLGDVEYYSNFIENNKANDLFEALKKEIEWEQKSILIFGKAVIEPRLSAWYGDKDAIYTYSNTKMTPLSWTRELLSTKKNVEEFTGCHFNSVLLNLYRNGRDYMGWHSDDEKELGNQPTIASLSLGEQRDFKFRNRRDKKETSTINLENGSLLLMKKDTQLHWQHSLPKRLKVSSPRINLTFRNIISSAHLQA